MSGFRQADDASRTSSGNLSFTMPLGNILAGSCLVMSVVLSASAATTLVTLTPTGGGVTWTQVARSLPNSSTQNMVTWIGLNSSGGTATAGLTIAVTGGTLYAAHGVVSEFTGVSVSLAQPDAVVVSIAVTETVSIPTPYTDTVYDADIVYAFWGGVTDTSTVSTTGGPTNAFTEIFPLLTTGNVGVRDVLGSVAYRVATLHGHYAPTWATSLGIAWRGHAFGLKLTGAAAALETTLTTRSRGVAMLNVGPSAATYPAVLDVYDRWRFAGVDLSTYAHIIKRADADTYPQLRGQDAALSGLTGEQFLQKLEAGRVIPIDLYVLATNDDGTDPGGGSDVIARTNLDTLNAVFAVRTPQLLERIMPDGTVRAAMAEVVSVADMDPTVQGFGFGLAVDFKLADPWFYGAMVVQSATISGSPQTLTVTHPGNVRGHKCWIEFIGAITNPKVTNLRTGQSVLYTGVVAANLQLLFDSATGCTYLAGVLVSGSVTHYSPPGRPAALMELLPGANPLLLESSSPGGSVNVFFQAPYV